LRRPVPGPRAPRPARRGHRGGRRGRRVLLHGRPGPAALPGGDGGEGDRLAAPARQGPAPAPLRAQPPQRGHRAVPGPGPVQRPQTVRAFRAELSEMLGTDIPVDDPETAIAKLGPIASMIGATLRHTANPTRLAAGYKDNVIPGRATATIDCRTLPGDPDE